METHELVLSHHLRGDDGSKCPKALTSSRDDDMMMGPNVLETHELSRHLGRMFARLRMSRGRFADRKQCYGR